MEISEFIREAFKEGSLDKVVKGIEQLVMMMINAIGMIEQREMQMENKIDNLEEDMAIVKSFLLSKPAPLPASPKHTPAPQKIPPAPSQPSPPHAAPPSAQPATAPTARIGTSMPQSGPSEEEIATFRQKLLKPTPEHEKPKPQPLSIRAALMQEMKNYFGTAMKKVKNEKSDTS